MSKNIKKSVGAKTFAYLGCLGSRIAHLLKISNVRSPRIFIYTLTSSRYDAGMDIQTT
ncbi:MAG: hypothetical protein IKW93_01955 [Bacteroidales bacterium]|nr:hypothetical protein [Bacteroidales bacterium]